MTGASTWQHIGETLRRPHTREGEMTSIWNPKALRVGSSSAVFDGEVSAFGAFVIAMVRDEETMGEEGMAALCMSTRVVLKKGTGS